MNDLGYPEFLELLEFLAYLVDLGYLVFLECLEALEYLVYLALLEVLECLGCLEFLVVLEFLEFPVDLVNLEHQQLRMSIVSKYQNHQ
jgi:hypothetical protein